jgi:hypothetical protein
MRELRHGDHAAVNRKNSGKNARRPLHITSGDILGGKLAEAGLPGEILDWHDLLYDGLGSPAGRTRRSSRRKPYSSKP